MEHITSRIASSSSTTNMRWSVMANDRNRGDDGVCSPPLLDCSYAIHNLCLNSAIGENSCICAPACQQSGKNYLSSRGELVSGCQLRATENQSVPADPSV